MEGKVAFKEIYELEKGDKEREEGGSRMRL